MSERTFERAVLDWLEDGSDRTQPASVDSVLLAIKTTPQERAPWLPRRMPHMSTNLRYAAAAAIVVIIAVGAIGLIGGRTSTPPLTPGPSTTASPGPTSARTPVAPTLRSATTFAPLGYPGSGTIEFTKHTAAGTDALWVIDPSGANARLVLDGACCGLFSPDGRQLALAAPGITPPTTQRNPALLGVELLDPAGRVVSVVPSDCGGCSILDGNYEPDAWSPDGRYIGLSMWSDSDPGQVGIAIADRDFPSPWGWSKLPPTGSHPDIPIAFSPDGTRLLFLRTTPTSGPTSFGSLFLLDLGSGSIRQVSPDGLTLKTNGLIQGPASWSADGEIVYAAADATGAARIEAVGAEPGTASRVLVAIAPGAASARFSPDGSKIVFDQASAQGPHDVFVMGPNGENPTNLTAAFTPGACCAQWSPDGRAVVFLGTPSDDSHYDLYIAAVDGSGIWQVTTEPNVYTGFLWGPGFR